MILSIIVVSTTTPLVENAARLQGDPHGRDKRGDEIPDPVLIPPFLLLFEFFSEMKLKSEGKGSSDAVHTEQREGEGVCI